MGKTNLLKGDLGDLHMARNIKKRPLREADAEEFVVRIDLKGPDGVTYDQISYIDGETDIDYVEGIYGYDSDIRDNVSPMTRADATALAAEIIENAPAGDVLVGVVPYSTIPNDSDGEPMDDDFAEDSEEPAPDEFDDSEMDEGESSEEDEDETMEESIARARNQLRKVQERVLAKAKNRKLREDEEDEPADEVIDSIAEEVYNTYSEDMFNKLESELDKSEGIMGPEDEQDYEELFDDIKAWSKTEDEIDLDEDPVSIAEVYMQSQNYEDFFQDRLQAWMDCNEEE